MHDARSLGLLVSIIAESIMAVVKEAAPLVAVGNMRRMLGN